MKCKGRWLYSVFEIIKFYCDNTSIHGVRYITQSGRHFTERIFWFVMCFCSWYATYMLIQGTYYNFEHSAVSFVVDTAYLNWNTTYPAVTVCEVEEPAKIVDVAKEIFGDDSSDSIAFYLSDIAFYSGVCQSCTKTCSKIDCPSDFDMLVNQTRAKCNRLIDECAYNGKPFECCTQFVTMNTELGPCYTFNSIQTQSFAGKTKFISNSITGPGELTFTAMENLMVFLHAPEDVPSKNHPLEERFPTLVVNDYNYFFQVASIDFLLLGYAFMLVQEIDNDPNLLYVPIEQRNCRFPHENPLKYHHFYSYSACLVECRINASIEMCNCTHHFQPHVEGVQRCNLSGLICLSTKSNTLLRLKAPGTNVNGIECNCLSSCDEPEYINVNTQVLPNDSDEGKSIVGVYMVALPSSRFKRNVVRTKLDLVVSMGSTAGLFVGASLLSIVELFYYLFMKNKNDPGDETEIKPTSSLLKKSKIRIPPARKQTPFVANSVLSSSRTISSHLDLGIY